MKKIIESFKSLDKLTYKIMKNGFKFCFAICIISIIILLAYETTNPNPILFHIGIATFELGLMYIAGFIICGFVVDGIKKQII